MRRETSLRRFTNRRISASRWSISCRSSSISSAAGILTGSAFTASSLVTLMMFSWCPVSREYRRPGHDNAPGPMDSGASGLKCAQMATGTGVRYP